jgi:hypothetical protein
LSAFGFEPNIPLLVADFIGISYLVNLPQGKFKGFEGIPKGL